MVKQSWVSTNDKSLRVTLAIFSASFHALATRRIKISRLDMGRKSFTCARDRIATALRHPNAVTVSAKTIAAAPSKQENNPFASKVTLQSDFFQTPYYRSQNPDLSEFVHTGWRLHFLWFCSYPSKSLNFIPVLWKYACVIFQTPVKPSSISDSSFRARRK